MSQTYDGPGRGRKQCPECQKFIGVRCHECVCGYKFGTNHHKEGARPAPKPRAQDGLDRFFSDEEPKPAAQAAVLARPSPRQHDHCRSVSTPAGKCPVKLGSSNPTEVEFWAHSVVAKGRESGIAYAVSALVYWIREFYEIGSREYRDVRGILEGIFQPEG